MHIYIYMWVLRWRCQSTGQAAKRSEKYIALKVDTKLDVLELAGLQHPNLSSDNRPKIFWNEGTTNRTVMIFEWFVFPLVLFCHRPIMDRVERRNQLKPAETTGNIMKPAEHPETSCRNNLKQCGSTPHENAWNHRKSHESSNVSTVSQKDVWHPQKWGRGR